jgi:Ca2+-binding EF-hand superfamily protein
MVSRSFVLTCSSVALVGLCQMATPVVTTVEAQSRPVNRIRFEEMDRNNDGVITRQEWNGSARSFEVHDWNNDGRLSGEEVRVGAQRNTNWETADHNPNRWERDLTWTRSAFTNLDHNRDGRLTDNEWHFDRETFLRVDRNRDNAITVAEFVGEGVEDLRGDNFDDIDRNNNGRIERAEWYGGANEFNGLDRNRDGFLTRYEVAGSQPSLSTYDEFNNLDYNRNGRLERSEWHWSNNSFVQRDTNRDGIISRQELESSGGTPGAIGAIGGQAQTNSQSVRVNSQLRWTDTGIVVRAGDIITLQSSGQIQMSDNAQDVASPAGSLSRRTAPDAPISGVLAGALIAKIGGYAPVAIGDQTRITAPVSGPLYLGVNDDHLPDNRGEFTVTVGFQNRTNR